MLYNRKMQHENEEKRNHLQQQKMQDKYNYFPFVSGELIEKHRANLGAQLKNDLQNYLDLQRNNRGGASLSHDLDHIHHARSYDGSSQGSRPSGGVNRLITS